MRQWNLKTTMKIKWLKHVNKTEQSKFFYPYTQKIMPQHYIHHNNNLLICYVTCHEDRKFTALRHDASIPWVTSQQKPMCQTKSSHHWSLRRAVTAHNLSSHTLVHLSWWEEKLVWQGWAQTSQSTALSDIRSPCKAASLSASLVRGGGGHMAR
jgi:hypothetical protein